MSAALADYAQNTQIKVHMKEFLKDGYRVGAEAVIVKFPTGDGSRQIFEGSVGISDGLCKITIMVGVALITHALETWF